MKLFFSVTAFSLLSLSIVAQNDIDAIRYSQTYFGGTSRSKAMAGSFGALGADGACMGINPAGIGLYRKGDINLSVGLRFFSVDATHNGTSNKSLKVNLPFDGVSLVGAWDARNNKEYHNAVGISCNQIANFASNISISGRSNQKSIANEFLANANGKSLSNLDNSYSGMAYDNYLIDMTDTLTNKYASIINSKYDLLQTKTIETLGKINEWCFNYAFGYKDKLYVGATLGIPYLTFNYNSIYGETDDKDSLKASNNTAYTYPSVGVGGFKNMAYQETFKTTGSGYNLKLGVIYRAADFIRLGASFQTPTVYSLTDTYMYKMTANYDEGGSFTTQYPPDNGGRFNYKIITPMKVTGSIAFINQKYGVLNVDYDLINYGQANLQSSPQEFTGVNQVIRTKYTQTGNLRVGAEANLNPFYIRLGYAMYGSPFGDMFQGDLVRTFYTGGVGFRKDKFYVDMSFTRSISTETYYMYGASYVDASSFKNFGTTIAVTVGSKF